MAHEIDLAPLVTLSKEPGYRASYPRRLVRFFDLITENRDLIRSTYFFALVMLLDNLVRLLNIGKAAKKEKDFLMPNFLKPNYEIEQQYSFQHF